MSSDEAAKLAKYRKWLADGLIDEEEFRTLTAGLHVDASGERAVAAGGDVRDSAIVTGDVGGDVVMPGGQKTETSVSTGDVEGGIHDSTIAGRDANITHIINHYYEARKMEPDGSLTPEQIAAYLEWVKDSYGVIELRGIQRRGEQVVQLALETVYVPLAAHTTWDRRQVALDEVLRLGRQIIITGGPGSGKTTVLLHLAYTLALAAQNPPLARQKLGLPEDDPLPLPIFVPLSSYALYRRNLPDGSPGERYTLAAFISDFLQQKQTSFNLPPDFFKVLLQTGRHVLLLLDGLDEVPNENERAEVRQAIEELLTGRREQMRVVATCRTAAYKGRSQLGRRFREVQVLSLKRSHIRNLVAQAYASIIRHAEVERQKYINDLMQAIDRLEAERRRRSGEDIEPLVNSPLMVRMLLIVHYSDRRLPEQRAALYQKATDAMLRPDYNPNQEVANRLGGLVGEDMNVHREMAQYLAFNMHRRGKQQGREIDEDALKKILGSHPDYGRYTDDFIALTRARGTLLEERLRQYRFLHLSFQEFLTARYLAEVTRSESGVDGIARFLEEGPLLESWWREPILLISGYLSIENPTAAQQFLRRLKDWPAGVSNEVRLAAAELAATAVQEWPAVPEGLKTELAWYLAALMREPTFTAKQRVAAGDVLARLGDPRPEVMAVAGMQFCPIPAGPFVMGEGEEQNKVGLREIVG